VDTAVNILNTNSREATPAGLANGPKRPVRIFAAGTIRGDSVTDAVEVTPGALLTTPTLTAGRCRPTPATRPSMSHGTLQGPKKPGGLGEKRRPGLRGRNSGNGKGP